MKNKSFFYTLALTAGALLPLAFAPFSFYPMAVLSLALLLWCWLKLHAQPKKVFLVGWLFGMGCFGVGVSWVYISIHTYGYAPMSLSLLITGIFIATLALFPALNGYLLTKISSKNTSTKIVILSPISWVFFEYLRSWVWTGFPWLLLGYSQIDSPLKGLAPIVGVYGVSLAVVFTSGAIINFFETRKLWLRIALVLSVAILWISSAFLSDKSWTCASGDKIRVSLIQSNIPLDMKWDAAFTAPILQRYTALSSAYQKSKLIILPEAAMPTVTWRVSKFLQKLALDAKKHRNYIITGIIYQSQRNGPYYNGMLALGKRRNLYLKRHLVPFGEFLPFKSGLSWILNFMHIPWSDFTAGPKQQPDFSIDKIKIAPFICYEIAYQSIVLGYLPQAKLLLTISEDSWFGRSIASAQQLEIARMRSLETGRYQLICANSGITAIIGPTGKVEAKAPSFHEVVLNGEVQAMVGSTPLIKYKRYLAV